MKNYLSYCLKVTGIVLVLASFLSGCSLPKATTTPFPSPTATATEPDDTDTPEPTIAATSTPIPTPTQPQATLTAGPTLSPSSAKDMLINAFLKLASAYPYRLTETTRGATTLDRTTDYAAADRIHSSWVLAPNPETRQTVTIGNETWWYLNGKWETTPSQTDAPVDLYSLLTPGIQSVQFVGQEPVMNIPCFVLSYTLTINTSGISISGNGKAWIGISDSLPHQVTLDGTISGSPFTTLLVYSYGIQFDIQQPVP